jgi:hypothetical protein
MQIFGSKKNKWYKQESQNLFWLSCLYHLFFLFPDFGSPVYTICFSCSQILALLFIPFGKTNGINRRAKICYLSFNADLWEQEKQMV